MGFLGHMAIAIGVLALTATAQAGSGYYAPPAGSPSYDTYDHYRGYRRGGVSAYGKVGIRAGRVGLFAGARAHIGGGRGIGASASVGATWYGGPKGYVSPRGTYHKQRVVYRKKRRVSRRPIYSQAPTYKQTRAYPTRPPQGTYNPHTPKQTYNNYSYPFTPTGGCYGDDWKFRCQASGYGSARKKSVLFVINWYQHKSTAGSIICQKKGANGVVTTMRPLPLNINMDLKVSGPWGSACANAGFKTPQLCDNDPLFQNRQGGDISSEHELVRTMTLIARNPKVSSSSVTKVGIHVGLGRLLNAEVGVQHKRLGYANRIQAGFKVSLFDKYGKSCGTRGMTFFEQSNFSVGQTLPVETCRVAAKKTPEGAPDARICNAPYTPRYGNSHYQQAQTYYSPRRPQPHSPYYQGNTGAY